MKKLVSFALGAALLFGAATLGLQSGSANAQDTQNKNTATHKMTHKMSKNMRKHHRKHHRRHRRHRVEKTKK
jgi:Ni/Co efflux regulator RcnB